MSTAFPYLGTPGAMVRLLNPDQDFDNPVSRGDVAHDLLSGAVGVSRRLNPKRSWALGYTGLAAVDADVLRAFYLGVYGAGPFVYVDPSVSNVLGLDVSSCGVRSQASPGWVTSGGTVAVDATQVSPVAGSAVLKWAAPAASATLQPGAAANTADTTVAPVVLAPEPVTVSLWVKASAAASLTLRAAGFTSAGAVSTVSQSASISVTTSFQRFTVTGAAGVYGTDQFVLPRLTAPATSPPANVWVAGAQLEYGTAAAAWQLGFGSPRVRIVAPIGRAVPLYGYSSHSLALAEA